MDTITVVIHGQIQSLCVDHAMYPMIQLMGTEKIYSSVADKEGSFKFNHIQAGQYKISTSCVGHQSIIDTLMQLGSGDVWDLKIVLGCEK